MRYLPFLAILILCCTFSEAPKEPPAAHAGSGISPGGDFYCYGMACALQHKEEVKQLFLNNLDSLGYLIQFPKLEYLNFAMTDMRELPKEILALSQLKVLDLQHNPMTRLPKDFYQLKNLEEIVLLFNDFEEIPPVFCKLPSLKKVNLTGNPITRFNDCLLSENDLQELFIGGGEHGCLLKESQLEQLKKATIAGFVSCKGGIR